MKRKPTKFGTSFFSDYSRTEGKQVNWIDKSENKINIKGRK